MAEKIDKCILCDTKCKITQGNGIHYNFSCKNCREYVVTIPEVFLLSGNQNFNKSRYLLSGLSYYNTISNLDPLHINSKNWEKLISNNNQIPTTLSKKSDLLLNHMYDLAEGRPNIPIENIPFPAVYGKDSDDLWSNFSDLKSQDFVTYDEQSVGVAGHVLYGIPELTINGVKKIEELRESNSAKYNYLADEKGDQIIDAKGEPIYLEDEVNSVGKVSGKLSIKSHAEKIENKDNFKKEQTTLSEENETSYITIPEIIPIKESNSIPKLEIETIADAFSKLIDNTPDKDNRGAFGVLGKWGRGKSYFIKYLTQSLKESDDFENIIVHFSAWQYQKTPEIWAYLYEKIAQKRFTGRSKLRNIFLHNYYKNKWGIVFEFFGPILWIIVVKLLWGNDIIVTKNLILTNSILFGVAVPPIIFSLYKIIKNCLSDINKIAVKFVRKYIARKSFGQVLGLQKEIQDELRSLLQSWIWVKDVDKKKIILIVDDIDRCKPDNILELLDTLRVVLDDPEISKRLKVIIAIDHLIVKDIMRKRFNDFFKDPEILNVEQYIRNYFDKLFLFSLHLAPLQKDEREQIIDSVYETSTLNIKRSENRSVPPNTATRMVIQPISNDAGSAGPIEFKSEINNQKTISQLQPMSEDELKLFKEIVSVLECTPRRIRILYYRYVFIKCLIDELEESDFNIEKSREIIEKIASYEKKNGKTQADKSEEDNNYKSTDKPMDAEKLRILNWVLFD